MAAGIFGLVFVLGMLIFCVCVFGFWIWMLVDCISNTPDKDSLKVIWILVIVFAGWIGALVYFFVQKPKNFQTEDLYQK